jgi:hypothetical protein
MLLASTSNGPRQTRRIGTMMNPDEPCTFSRCLATSGFRRSAFQTSKRSR